MKDPYSKPKEDDAPKSTSTTTKKAKGGAEAKKKDIKVKSYMKKTGAYYTPFKRTKQKPDNKNLYSKKKG
jgi:hypothetical protein